MQHAQCLHVHTFGLYLESSWIIRGAFRTLTPPSISPIQIDGVVSVAWIGWITGSYACLCAIGYFDCCGQYATDRILCRL